MLKLAIIGVGGLGKVHLKNIVKLERKRDDIKLTALCAVNIDRIQENTVTNLESDSTSIDFSEYRLYTNINELLEKEELDFIIIAVPTYLHSKITELALGKGLHVFSEKPMALNLEQCRSMINKAKENKKILMIGQCLRYWPEYKKLKEFIDNKTYGSVIRASFSRFGFTPSWSWQNWMLDDEKSGGAALDLHIHDIDYINWVFGKPASVSATATHYKTKFDSISTQYKYHNKVITSDCDWGMSTSFPFQSSFLVRFEKAVVEKNLHGMTIYADGADPVTLETEKENAYMNEICDFLNCITSNRESIISPCESSMQSIEIALAEKASALKGSWVNV